MMMKFRCSTCNDESTDEEIHNSSRNRKRKIFRFFFRLLVLPFSLISYIFQFFAERTTAYGQTYLESADEGIACEAREEHQRTPETPSETSQN